MTTTRMLKMAPGTSAPDCLRAKKVAPLLLARECLEALAAIVTRLEAHDGSLGMTGDCLTLKRRVEALITDEHRRLWGLQPVPDADPAGDHDAEGEAHALAGEPQGRSDAP